MPIQKSCTVVEAVRLNAFAYSFTLEAEGMTPEGPDQFVHVKCGHSRLLRRPISICDWDEESLTLIYKVVGKGTDAMTRIKPPHRLDLLVGLGNGYDTAKSGQKPLLLGGGVGVPPLYGLCKALLREGKDVTVILGFNAKEELFYEEEFKALGTKVFVTTVDGSCGEKGFVTDVMKNLDYTYFYTCGPGPMFRAIEKTAVTSGQFSFEARMGCGFGACMGCSCQTKYGSKRICKDGPVLRKEEIVW